MPRSDVLEVMTSKFVLPWFTIHEGADLDDYSIMETEVDPHIEFAGSEPYDTLIVSVIFSYVIQRGKPVPITADYDESVVVTRVVELH